MVSKEVILTHGGLLKLEKELEQLKSVKRKEVASRIKIAIDFGDISENSEYEDAKNEQAFIEGRIITLEKMLRNAILIDEGEINTDNVSVGSTVTLKDLEFDEDVDYTIVGTAEANPGENKISNESPVGKAILGKPVGSIVEVSVPAGNIKYQILSIKK
ncbi:transcription elongation factor GreA [Candidatus Contubernalis alkaliaceticus]|uniref:transcription elongation factor GreA n=1 Tax=Candidatus Contubernalis alkaliaceticus TaxID=338645 RepID=UPI001F4BF162|nr:transcription elongation factor GreA [Candidatus Contubernalis alkalaceticus]UNC93408.1 transcription elongation factor GreA [Candidatus Contubernalis alkalaceticus]